MMTLSNITELIDFPIVILLTLIFIWMEKRKKNYSRIQAVKRGVFVFIVFALFKLLVEVALLRFGIY
jgi:hypothetical protein